LYPILVNIFLERFDIFIEKLASIDMTNNRVLNHDFLGMSSVKISYVRYEDQWILGIEGSYLDCVNILNNIKNFFKQELFLELPDESVEIINTKLAKYVIFLGVRIRVSSLQLKKVYNNWEGKTLDLNHNKNYNYIEIRLEAPIKYIIGKLTKAGFLKDQKPVPKLIWTSYEKDVILYLYHSIYQNIINYYSFVSNRHKLDSWLYKVLNSSCMKLLASKFSLSSQKKVINRFGPNLINRPLYLPPHSQKKIIFFGAVIKRFSSSFPAGARGCSPPR
jgi:hypothetical protein